MFKQNRSAVRRFLAIAVIICTAVLASAPPAGTLSAAASGDETLGNSSRPAISVDFSRLFTREALTRDNSGRILIPGGSAVGVAIRTAGVLIVGLGEGAGMQAGLRAGDVLQSVNGVPLSSADILTEAVSAAGGQPISLNVERDGRQRQLVVTPQFDEQTQSYRLGVWVRDSTAGVGTLTYYDQANNVYGALGHAITDSDTGSLLTVGQGSLLRAEIVDVRKGQRGAPGELRGSFLREQVRLGTVVKNTPYGIYGQMEAQPAPSLYPDGLPVASRSQVHTGAATIISTVNGEEAQEYAIEITQVSRQNSPAQKSLVLRVTDERLLASTGGIVQGMSGSPILQDGFIVGAVTHVFVSDPTQGYGVFIDWMLNQSDMLL